MLNAKTVHLDSADREIIRAALHQYALTTLTTAKRAEAKGALTSAETYNREAAHCRRLIKRI